jgi:dihydroxyacetone kinase-like predicted kinase
VRSARADSVILLPNNRNVILTAQQVDQVAEGIDVRVVPTRNLPEGISAMLALDPAADMETNRARMEESLSSVHALEVTRAVRDSSADGRDIKEGDVIAVYDGKISGVGDEELGVIEQVLADLPVQPELITVYFGAGVDVAAAEALVAALGKQHPDTEFELHDGGQEHYPYILSLE